MQDNRGFMWFGTINGLNRYNGKEFIVMLSQTGNFASLPDNRIRSLQEDREGYIWIRTTANIFCCYDPRLERLVDYDPENRQKYFTQVRIFSNGDVWLWGNGGGCCRVRHNDGKLQSLRFGEAELGSSAINFVHEDASQRIWIGSGNGLFCLEGDRAVKMSSEVFFAIHELDEFLFFINDRHITPFNSIEQRFIAAIGFPGNKPISLNMTVSLNKGLILLATKEDIIAFDSPTMKFIPAETLFDNQAVKNASFYTDNHGNKWVYNLSGSVWRQFPDNHFERIDLIPANILSVIDAERYEIYHDSRDIVWITTYGNGLFALDQNNGKTYHYTVNNSNLPTDYLLCVTEDKSGEIWVGTEFAGISKISLSNYPVRILLPEPKKNDNLSNAVRLIYGDSKNRFWLGTRSGYLHIYGCNFKKLKSHRIPGGLPFTATEDLDGNIWLGTRGNGVMVFPPSGDSPIHHYRLRDVEPESNNSNNVFDLIRDSKNRIWVASFGGGLHYADLNEKEITFHQINTRTTNQNRVRVIMQDRKQLIWAGTNEGVIVFNPDELIRDHRKYINFHFDVNDNSSVNNNEVKAIFEDSKGRIWLGTTGGGLNLLIREEPIERSHFKHFTAKDGLSNEVIQTIAEDEEGFIWVSTEGGSGISKFDPEKGSFENFTMSNHSQAGLFNEGARWKTADGKLMFGSYFGVYIFNPSEIKSDAYAPPVVITGFKINGANVYPETPNSPLTGSISLAEEIRLKHNQNSFNIEFAMLNFHASAFNQYAYFLDGYEKQRNPVTKHNVVAYRNVPPGTYSFKVRGSNSFGMWTDKDTQLKIVIAPPFWQSHWAYGLYALAALVVIFFAVRIIQQINRLYMAVEVERQLTEYKLRFFTNISHEFRTPLTIIRGSIESLTDMEGLPVAVSKQINQMAKSANRLLRLIDQLLEFRKLQNKGLQLRLTRTEAVAFFYDIYQTFQELAEKKKIDFLFQTNQPRKQMLLDTNKWDKIVYNLLSNAMKHTPDHGTVVMRLDFSEPDADRFSLSVADSGVGVPKEMQSALFVRFNQFNQLIGGTGVGLHLTAELAATHKGKIEYTDSELGGACFTVTIPVGDDNYKNLPVEEALPTAEPTEPATDDNAPADTSENATTGNRHHTRKLLIIEDDDEVREFISSQLTGAFSVLIAKDGSEGLEKATQEQPTLIVCDVMMPGIDGFELTRRLKDDFQTSHIPIILLTAHSSEEHRLEGIQAGADSYIIKPFSIKYLIARINKLIEQREKLQQKFVREPGMPIFPISATNKDREFIDRVNILIEHNMSNADFSVDTFAQTVGLGRTNFYRKIKGLTGHSPNEYLRIVRMKKAAELLSTTQMNVSEVSYKVGINDPFYFSKCFKAQFGKSPSQFQKG
jgi:signal transduction histidine kinase/DNA-binding response OmpR family regulator/ligand-binding sensor domain-containing protein